MKRSLCTTVTAAAVLFVAASPQSVSAQSASNTDFRLAVSGAAAVFEPGVISLPETNDEYLSFSPDGQTAVFTRREGRTTHLFETWRSDGSWSEPALISFSGEFSDNRGAFSPDGSRMYFASNRPHTPGSGQSDNLDIWVVSRSADGTWGRPRPLAGPMNTTENESHPSVAVSGNLYFVRWFHSETDIFVSEWTETGYADPRALGETINTAGPDSHPFIDPEERFLLFAPTGREDGFGGGDIYVSYPTESGWSEASNLGPQINTDYYEYSARVGPNGRITFSRAGFGAPEVRPADVYVIDLVERSTN